MTIVADGPVHIAQLIEGKTAIEDGFEVGGVQLNSAVVVFDRLPKVLPLAGLPPVGMQEVCLP